MASAFEGIHGVVDGIVEEAAFVIEVAAALILVIAVLAGFCNLARSAIARRLDEETRRIRLRFGRGVVLALEFLVAADVLRTMIAPTLERVALVGAIVVLRTVLAVAVEWEIRQVEREGRDVSG